MKKVPDQNQAPDVQAPEATGRGVSVGLETYYSGCAMVVSSPAEISLYFGRYVLSGIDRGKPTLSQVYEKQVYMAVDEAEKLAEAIVRTVRVFRSRNEQAVGPGQESIHEADPSDIIKI